MLHLPVINLLGVWKNINILSLLQIKFNFCEIVLTVSSQFILNTTSEIVVVLCTKGEQSHSVEKQPHNVLRERLIVCSVKGCQECHAVAHSTVICYFRLWNVLEQKPQGSTLIDLLNATLRHFCVLLWVAMCVESFPWPPRRKIHWFYFNAGCQGSDLHDRGFKEMVWGSVMTCP